MSGTVIWITGLSGAGKTTVAKLVVQQLRDAGLPVVHVDGDVFRAILDAGESYDPSSRFKLASCYGRLCHELARQGVHVVCSTISMFHAVREWNRREIENYLEVYLRVPVDVLKERDAKGLYQRQQLGEAGAMVGIDLQFDAPRSPDLVIDNCHDTSAELAARQIVERAKLI